MILRPLRTTLNRMLFAKVKAFKQQAQPEQQSQPLAEKKGIDPASVIKKFRREVLEKTIYNEQHQQLEDLLKDYDTELKNVLTKGTRDEQLHNSRKIVERFINDKQVFSLKSQDPLMNNYAHYSPYKSAKVTQQKVSRTEAQGSQMLKGLQFIQNLGPEYLENQMLNETLSQSFDKEVSIEDYAKYMQTAFDDATMASHQLKEVEIKYPDPLTLDDEQTTGGFSMNSDHESKPITNLVYEDDHQVSVVTYAGENNFGRLSPMACEEIFKTYLDGWTVRDISQRFGIHPRRTKFVVWCRAQYYLEVLPRMGFRHFKECMLMEIEYGQKSGFMDYGMDLNTLKLERENTPMRVTSWNNRMVDIKGETDHQRERKRLEAIEILQKKNGISTPRHDKVLLGYFGTENKLTEIRDWKIHRAKGSELYHTKYKTFRKLFKKQGRETYK